LLVEEEEPLLTADEFLEEDDDDGLAVCAGRLVVVALLGLVDVEREALVGRAGNAVERFTVELVEGLAVVVLCAGIACVALPTLLVVVVADVVVDAAPLRTDVDDPGTACAVLLADVVVDDVAAAFLLVEPLLTDAPVELPLIIRFPAFTERRRFSLPYEL
jgi:hypothetical protein